MRNERVSCVSGICCGIDDCAVVPWVYIVTSDAGNKTQTKEKEEPKTLSLNDAGKVEHPPVLFSFIFYNRGKL